MESSNETVNQDAGISVETSDATAAGSTVTSLASGPSLGSRLVVSVKSTCKLSSLAAGLAFVTAPIACCRTMPESLTPSRRSNRLRQLYP